MFIVTIRKKDGLSRMHYFKDFQKAKGVMLSYMYDDSNTIHNITITHYDGTKNSTDAVMLYRGGLPCVPLVVGEDLLHMGNYWEIDAIDLYRRRVTISRNADSEDMFSDKYVTKSVLIDEILD